MRDKGGIWRQRLRAGFEGSRGRAAALLGQFLIFMMACTVLSRALYTARMVQVTVGNSRSMSLDHVVEAEGTVLEGPKSAVLIPAGMRIAQVLVREGQQVEAGEELLLLDCEDIQEQLLKKRKEEERLRLQLEAARENAARQAADAQRNQTRAEEDYNDAVAAADSQAEEARAAWEEAVREREQLAGWDSYLAGVQQEDLTLRQLDGTIGRLEQELSDLRQELDHLQAEREQAATGHLQGEREQAATGAAGESAPDTGKDEDAENVAAQILAKEQELIKARAEREQYLAQLSQDSRQQWEQKRASLEETERQAQRSYEGIRDSGEQNVQAASRALEDASQKPLSDSSLALLSMDVEAAGEECAALEALLATEGRICAEKAGQIAQVSAENGRRTTDEPAFLLAAGEGELTFQALLTKEQSRYVNVGDECVVSFDSGRRKVEGLTVLSLTESKEEENRYRLTLLLPAGQAAMGQSGTFRLVRQTTNYSTCVPLEALRTDSRQQTYVLVLSHVETFLGEELTAVKRPVKVLDKNGTYAALEEGAIGAEEAVIVSADGIIEEGDIVRMEEP